LGGLTTIPLVYGLTYAIGRVMEQYLMARQKNQKLSAEQIKSLWTQFKKEGEQRGKSAESSIKKQSSKEE
jgi:uncharacterized protein (DUF697 family)